MAVEHDAARARVHGSLDALDRMEHAIVEDQELVEPRRDQVIEIARALGIRDARVARPGAFLEEQRLAAGEGPLLPIPERIDIADAPPRESL